MNRSSSLFLIACLATSALVVAACATVEHDIDSLTLELDESCPSWDCGANGPEINGFPVDELNLAGKPNAKGFVIKSFVSSNFMSLKLDVQDGEFRGLDAVGDPIISGPGVVGGIITVDDGVNVWEIMIQDYTYSLPYWVAPAGFVSAYHLVYRSQSDTTGWSDLCKDPRSVATDPTWPGGYETYALLIQGERYDRQAKTVKAPKPDDQNWFNIACAGGALSKMVLLGYDPKIALGSAYHTTPQERQATLKMLTADYCGTGRPFTVSGHPLLWENDAGWHTVDPNQNKTLEAVWDENGATCLTTPRLEIIEPGITVDIQAECALPPPCADPDPNWAGSGEWRTHNPL